MEGTYEAHCQRYYRLGPHERKDIAEILQMPIPKQVWEELKLYQPKHFVEFMDSLTSTKKSRVAGFLNLIRRYFQDISTKG